MSERKSLCDQLTRRLAAMNLSNTEVIRMVQQGGADSIYRKEGYNPTPDQVKQAAVEFETEAERIVALMDEIIAMPQEHAELPEMARDGTEPDPEPDGNFNDFDKVY